MPAWRMIAVVSLTVLMAVGEMAGIRGFDLIPPAEAETAVEAQAKRATTVCPQEGDPDLLENVDEHNHGSRMAEADCLGDGLIEAILEKLLPQFEGLERQLVDGRTDRYTDPDGLRATLMDVVRAYYTFYFMLYNQNTATQGSGRGGFFGLEEPSRKTNALLLQMLDDVKAPY